MAADQLNKRSEVSNVIRHAPWEQPKTKKKKFSHRDSNMRSCISLEWDDKKEHVVPKKEQISIGRRELTPFLPHDPRCQNVLGDVFAAPPELFELDNLTGLLSYEVWQTHLSVKEREFLIQLLPEGLEPHKVVHELLAGNNLYFGNPFPKWGASICSGDCHPDAVLHQEQCNKANKIAYYSELHKYHTKMIGSLQLWKERWASCVNPENDFMQKILRSRQDFHKSGSSHENDPQSGPDDNFGATSDSCSWDADDKSYSSDSPNVTMENGETIIRVSRRDLESKYYDSSGGWRSVAKPGKGDKLEKRNIECGDGAKYMSYIKVSKEQHQRVKSSMKHSNTSIQRRALNYVLGNLDSFCVQPYEVFEEEERQKLHEHWSHLAKKDLPAGFENWISWRSAKSQLTTSLRKEIEDKQKLNVLSVLDLCNQDEDNEKVCISLLRGTCNATLDNGLMDATKDEEKEQSLGSLHHEQQAVGEKSEQILIAQEDNEEQNTDSIFQSEADPDAAIHETAMQIEHTDESNQDSAQNHHLQQIAIPSGSQNFCPMAINSSNTVLTESDAFPSHLGEYTESLNHTEAPVGEQYPLPSAASELWPTVSLPSAYYHQPTFVSHGYASSSELLHGHPQVKQDQSSQGIAIEPGIQQKDPLRSFLNRRFDGGDTFFNPYANQDRNELLLHSLFKDPGRSPYLHEQKLSRLGLHPSGSDAMLGTGQFPRNSCLSLPLDIRQKRLGDVYLPQNIQENIYADGGDRFLIPRQEHLLPLNHVQDWPGNGGVNMPMPASSHHRLNGNGELSSQNWFCGDEVVGDGWSGGVVPNQDIGNVSQVADESLFSVLSQCSGLHSGVHFGLTGATEPFILSGNHVGMGGGAVPPMTSNAVPPRTALNYMSGNEAQSNGMGWINLPRQNAALRDTVGKSLARSWNDNDLG